MNAISAATDKDKCAKFIHNMQNEKGSQMASLTQFWKKCQLRRLLMKATILLKHTQNSMSLITVTTNSL